MPLPDITNWWAVETMVASYNHVYQVVYKTNYILLGSVGVSDYGNAPIASFQVEFLALDDNPQTVVSEIQKYKLDGRKHVLNFFHAMPSAKDQKKQYAELGYDFVRTGPIMGIALREQPPTLLCEVEKISSRKQLEEANEALKADNESIPPETLEDPHIHNYISKLDGQIAGWGQLVAIQPGIGYINQLHTLTSFRKRFAATSMMAYIHADCVKQGIDRMALVSSDMAMGVYRRLGYHPLAFFTALKPKTDQSTLVLK